MEINKLIDKYLLKSEKDFISILRDADNSKYQIYLVGGALRDILLGITPKEIDIAVIGDTELLINYISRISDIKLIQKSEFGTYKIVFQNKIFDIASTRIEAYLPKGSLPKITNLSVDINKDLYRRDFTINSMAYFINNEFENNLIDPYGGQKDLKNKLIRTIHNESFIDDPTRIYRLLRYSVRLGFEIELSTLQLAEKNKKFIEQLSTSRVVNEIKKSSEEINPENIFNKFEEFNIFKYFYNNDRKLNINFTNRPKIITNYEYLVVYLAYHNQNSIPYFINKINFSKSLKLKIDQICNLKNLIEYINTEGFVNFPITHFQKLKKIKSVVYDLYISFENNKETISLVTEINNRLINCKPKNTFNLVKNILSTDDFNTGKVLQMIEVERFRGLIKTISDEDNYLNKKIN